MVTTQDVLRALAGMDGPVLAEGLRKLRSAASDALDGSSSLAREEAVERFRTDDLVPLADLIAFFAEEAEWARVGELEAEEAEWARLRDYEAKQEELARFREWKAKEEGTR
jgi:hypothetical protein